MQRPRKIVLVGPFDQLKKSETGFGNFYYGLAWKLANGFIRAGHMVWPFSDRDVARALSPLHTRKLGVGPANRALARVCANIRPDLLILFHADIIAPETVLAVRQAGHCALVAGYYIDPLYYPGAEAKIRRVSDIADAMFFTTGGESIRPYKTARNRVGFLPNAVDPAMESRRAFAEAAPDSDVFFSAADFMEDPRIGLALGLQNAVPGLRYAYHGFGGRPGIFGDAYMEALGRTRLGLNLNRWPEADDPGRYRFYASDRMAHYVGNGVLALSQRGFGYGEMLGEDALALFDTPDELADKTRHFTGNDAERRRVAEKGHALYHRHCGAEAVARALLDVTEGRAISGRHPWSDEVY
jgi:hypothetical protein